MRNITITLEEKVARWARLRAAELNTSVSRLLGNLLGEAMRRERAYENARRSWLSTSPQPLSGSKRYPGREELHDRARLR